MTAPRWHFRFENFKSALAKLDAAVEGLLAGRLSELEQEGLIQRFEYTWELGWKSMRDYLVDSGVSLPVRVPVNIIRAGFEAGLIDDGDAWMAAKEARNQMSHEYDRGAFERVVAEIGVRYHPLLVKLRDRLEAQRAAGN